MTLELIDYLRANGVERLQQEYAIKVLRHTHYPNLVLLKYDQLNSPMGAAVVQQCRGLVLDEAANWAMACFPYTKFFNYGEALAAPIDWDTARVYEKLDGSLMTLYFYDGQWHVASSGNPEAGGPMGSMAGATMAQHFWQVWDSLGYRLPADPRCSYMFELMTTWNRVVVRHEQARIVLHGVRDNLSYEESRPEAVAAAHGWECAPFFPLSSWESVVAAAAALDPMCSEGYVVSDDDFHRVKVKCPAYVALHHLKDGFSMKRMVELVRANESDEFLSYFPEFEASFLLARDRYDGLIAEIDAAYATLRDMPSQKEFALGALPYRYSGVLFSLRAGKVASAEEYLRGMLINKLLDWLGLRDDQELAAPES